MKLIFCSPIIFIFLTFSALTEASGYHLGHFCLIPENTPQTETEEPPRIDSTLKAADSTQKRNEEINKAIKVIQIIESKRFAGLLSIFPAQIAAISGVWFYFRSEDYKRLGENYFFRANNSFSQKEIDSNFEKANYYISKSNKSIMYRNLAFSTALFFAISTIYFYFSGGK